MHFSSFHISQISWLFVLITDEGLSDVRFKKVIRWKCAKASLQWDFGTYLMLAPYPFEHAVSCVKFLFFSLRNCQMLHLEINLKSYLLKTKCIHLLKPNQEDITIWHVWLITIKRFWMDVLKVWYRWETVQFMVKIHQTSPNRQQTLEWTVKL